jgi:hypothetical protein
MPSYGVTVPTCDNLSRDLLTYGIRKLMSLIQVERTKLQKENDLSCRYICGKVTDTTKISFAVKKIQGVKIFSLRSVTSDETLTELRNHVSTNR